LRGGRVVADQRVAEHECHRFGHLVRVADKRERGPHFARRQVIRVFQFLRVGELEGFGT
jgi:hypothetical protein